MLVASLACDVKIVLHWCFFKPKLLKHEPTWFLSETNLTHSILPRISCRPQDEFLSFFHLLCFILSPGCYYSHEKATLLRTAICSLNCPSVSRSSPIGVLAFRASALNALPAHSESLISDMQFREVEARLSVKLQSHFCCYRETCCHQREAKVACIHLAYCQTHLRFLDVGAQLLLDQRASSASPLLYPHPKDWAYFLYQGQTLPRMADSTAIHSLQEKC